jgi:hypothetical protein
MKGRLQSILQVPRPCQDKNKKQVQAKTFSDSYFQEKEFSIRVRVFTSKGGRKPDKKHSENSASDAKLPKPRGNLRQIIMARGLLCANGAADEIIEIRNLDPIGD